MRAIATQQPELLDITQAAAFLRVSATSLRRWTDAGRLPCFRVGGRRERRFRRADLLAFMESPRAPQLDHEPRHVCGLYQSAAGRERRVARFLADALATGSTCFLAAGPDVSQRVLRRLARERPSVPRDVRMGRLVLSLFRASAATQLKAWERAFAAAVRAGALSLRVVGDVSGGPLGRRPFREVLDLERAYEESLSSRFPVTSLCLYDAGRLTGVEVARVVELHPYLFRRPAVRLMSE
ncbi:MAG TPA: MEDS domain-containing protein [Gemmatimonadales bacterium]|nr:MEDS domain-containing protein [Gemmatimonadales bacterium]